MLSLDKIEESILELEQADTCFQVCDRLASLYVVRDHYKQKKKNNEMVENAGESEFLQACDGKSVNAVLSVINEMMDAIQVLHPRMYDKILRQISE